MGAPKKVVVGVTGASGSAYAQRLLTALKAGGVEVVLIFSKNGRLVWGHEVTGDPADLCDQLYASGDMTAEVASGSAQFDAMVVVPCSAGTLGRIATGVSTNLIGRVADVTLKERRKLVLVLRESPYSLIAIRNMAAVTEAGAIVLPASPSFYSKPGDINALIDTVVSRVLDQLGVENTVSPRWKGMNQ